MAFIKKITAAISAALQLSLMLSYSANAAESTLNGDVNDDGNFNTADITAMNEYLHGKSQALENWQSGDVCNDNELDVFDLASMRKMITDNSSNRIIVTNTEELKTALANAKPGDIEVNPIKGKKLTNMRAAGKDDNVLLYPPRVMSLEVALSYIEDDELVEVTPHYIRLRKKINKFLDAFEVKGSGSAPLKIYKRGGFLS